MNKTRGPARGIWDKHGSIIIMLLVAGASFNAGSEWQRTRTIEAVQTLIVEQKERQDKQQLELRLLTQRVEDLAGKVNSASTSVAKAAQKVEQASENSNGTQTKPVKKP